VALSTADFNYVRDLVQRRSSIVLEPEKAYLVDARLQGLARREGFPSPEDLVSTLRTGPTALMQKVVEAMTTNETSFFRDIHPFEALRKTILPDLIRKRSSERRLAIWCGASSTGQEPYTMALILREHFPELATWTVRFLATDLSTEVLDKARKGRYSQLEINRGMPAPLLVKYFVKEGIEWVLKEDVRRMIEFAKLNLIEPWPLVPPVDLVMLRNVLIYFDIATKKQILAKIRSKLRPDGVLILGGAETTHNLDEAYERVPGEKFSCYRVGKPS
jgi:chemotaxis protein methyltransferase CheR